MKVTMTMSDRPFAYGVFIEMRPVGNLSRIPRLWSHIETPKALPMTEQLHASRNSGVRVSGIVTIADYSRFYAFDMRVISGAGGLYRQPFL